MRTAPIDSLLPVGLKQLPTQAAKGQLFTIEPELAHLSARAPTAPNCRLWRAARMSASVVLIK